MERREGIDRRGDRDMCKGKNAIKRGAGGRKEGQEDRMGRGRGKGQRKRGMGKARTRDRETLQETEKRTREDREGE